MNINETVAKKVLDTIDAGLVRGIGDPTPGKMCVEAAVCYAIGQPHGDDPICVSRSLRQLKILLNDAYWSSDKARANGLRRLGVAQLGSTENFDEFEFGKRVTRLMITKYLSEYFTKQSESLKNATTFIEMKNIVDDIWVNTHSPIVWTVANYASRSIRYASGEDPSEIKNAILSAANSANVVIWISSLQRAEYGPPMPQKDYLLIKFAEDVVQILIDMKAPGTKWLYLTENNGDENDTK